MSSFNWLKDSSGTSIAIAAAPGGGGAKAGGAATGGVTAVGIGGIEYDNGCGWGGILLLLVVEDRFFLFASCVDDDDFRLTPFDFKIWVKPVRKSISSLELISARGEYR